MKPRLLVRFRRPGVGASRLTYCRQRKATTRWIMSEGVSRLSSLRFSDNTFNSTENRPFVADSVRRVMGFNFAGTFVAS